MVILVKDEKGNHEEVEVVMVDVCDANKTYDFDDVDWEAMGMAPMEWGRF